MSGHGDAGPLDTAEVPPRERRFRDLCSRLGIELDDDPQSTGEEDAQAMLDPDDPDYVLERYCLVTRAGEYVYVHCYSSLGEAQEKAWADAGDSIYAESPACIADLDTGAVWVPDYEKTPWKEAR